MKNYLSLVKFSHTIFALPFAMLGFFLAITQTNYSFNWQQLLAVLLCMVFARNAAMAFNRYLDRDIDAKNPRTKGREIPAGLISLRSAFFFVLANCFLFCLTTWFINTLCFLLAPIALFIVLGYSYTKRFTAFCHFVLGLGLSLAPIGAYLAVTGQFDLHPLLYSLVVLLWVAGFDIIYALQDRDFDASLHLHSLPVWLGKKGALNLSSFLHLLCGLLVLLTAWIIGEDYAKLNFLHWIGAILFVGLLIYQHLLVKPDDLSRVNIAFFTTNGLASIGFGLCVIIDLLF